MKVSGAVQSVVSAIGAGQYLIGSDRNERLVSRAGTTMEGGRGDDTYILWQPDARVVEHFGQGVDTAIAHFAGNVTLAGNVENLVLAGRATNGATGNALDNLIWAGTAAATLDGGAGNDMLFGGDGADIFRVRAGNGSDTVANFKPGHDVVRLDGYGIDSFDTLMSGATQVGKDVLFTFANNERLLVTGVSKSELSGFDFGFAIEKAPLAEGQTLMDGHARAQNWNGWYVINNSYGVGDLKPGVDFTIDSTFDRSDVTAGTTFTWSMPYTTQIGAPILAYPEVVFGVPPKGAHAANPGDTAMVFPVRVGDLAGFTADYDVSFTGNVAGFNVAYDIWLTDRPNGDRSTITNEIMVWVHKGDLEISAPVVGTLEQDGVNYTIYHKDTYTAFVADRDVPKGELDVSALLNHLKTLGIVSDDEYLASLELGAEVVSGVGSLTIHNLDLTVSSVGENGTTIVKQVTGAGQSVQEVEPAPAMPAAPPPEPISLESRYADGKTAFIDDHGLTRGSVTTSVSADSVTRHYHNDKGALLSFDKIVIEANGGLATQHYSSRGVFQGAESEHRQADGSTNTYHYDAFWNFTGATNTLTKANGDVQVLQFDADWQRTGADVRSVGADGRVTTQHYDAAWTFKGLTVELVDQNGAHSVQHYDSNSKFAGQDSTFTRDDGSIATYHYDAAWQMTGYDVSRVGKDGVVKTLIRDGDGKLLSTQVTGTDGADTIAGSNGDNMLRGGLGSDVLKGNKGVDAFVFDTTIGRGDIDTVAGFRSGQDKLVLGQDIFDTLQTGGLSADALQFGSVARDADDRILYDAASGALYYDGDGNGAGKAVQFATLTPGTQLNAFDFAVVATDDVEAAYGAGWHSLIGQVSDLHG